MYEALNLSEAAALLAEKTKGHFSKDNTLRIIMAGAQGRIPVYWRNSSKIFSVLFGFTKEVEDRTRDHRLLQVSLHDLARLEITESIHTHIFEPTNEDLIHLEAAGSEDGFRAITEPGGVTVNRCQLYVFEQDILNMAANDAPQESIAKTEQDPERRLALLRKLGGDAKYIHGKWRFPGIAALVKSEKDKSKKRSDPKTIRADLKVAAQAEKDAKRAGPFDGITG